jgi:hypothetical protein
MILRNVFSTELTDLWVREVSDHAVTPSNGVRTQLEPFSGGLMTMEKLI